MTSPYVGRLTVPTDTNAAADGIKSFKDLAAGSWPRLTWDYANAGARNAEFEAWVAAGNTMRDGLVCTVAGWPQVYRGGKWRGIGQGQFYTGVGPPTFGPWTIPIGDTTPRVIGRVTIDDPGYEYRVRVFASAEIYTSDAGGSEVSTTAYRVDSKMELANTAYSWDLWRGDVGNLHKHADVTPVGITGASIINFIAYRATGASGYWKSTNLNFSMHAEVVPV